jgi:hypothetical protein
MKRLAVVLAILPLAIAMGACSRQGERGTGNGRSIVAPEPPPLPSVRDAAWVSDRTEVARAAAIAAAHPLVRRALEEADASQLAFVPGYALRGTGRTDDDRSVSITILPYVTRRDSTHATFLSLLESGGDAAVSHAEVIWGRDPRADETGFAPFDVGGARGWLREDDLRVAEAPRDGLLSPERFNKQKFFTCFESLGPQFCAQGAALSDVAAPGIAFHEAVGCAGGAAVAAAVCALAALEK